MILKDATTFISTATEAEVEALYRALKNRSKRLSDERAESAQALAVGSKVELVNISPKRLAGFTGTLEQVQGKAALVKLDGAPTWERGVDAEGRIRVHVACIEAI